MTGSLSAEERRDRPRLNLQPRTKPVPEIERKDEPEMSEEKTRFTEGPKPVEAESYTGETLAAGERRKLVCNACELLRRNLYPA